MVLQHVLGKLLDLPTEAAAQRSKERGMQTNPRACTVAVHFKRCIAVGAAIYQAVRAWTGATVPTTAVKTQTTAVDVLKTIFNLV